ncbi:DUF502 domain-containing protein [Kordiimonas pumila]|uniref:DUF502 domain-containing protein n=1 Tax=Kordiimonas pumila TaxID=2161677 RepID=A0ABV7D3F5_9PROT|nr:DUF502 domain-containing protein [Kordiimonas pumila]
MNGTDNKPTTMQTTQKYILLGIFTLIPLWLTFALIDLLLSFILGLAQPFLVWITAGIHPADSLWYPIVKNTWLQTAMALILVFLVLYGVGWLASVYLGRKVLGYVDKVMNRIPFVKSIYKAIKGLTDAVQTKPSEAERVVMIEFPSPDMKTIGLVTRTFKDSNTGRELAAVYVPTTPNPTSGYLEIVPVDKLVPTNWKMDEAMSFIISGGTDIPPNFVYDRPPIKKPEPPETL